MRILKKVLGAIGVLLVLAVVAFFLVLRHDSPCGPTPAPAANATLMKAIVYRCYGSPQVLRYEDIEKPKPADDEVLVRVHAASLNPLDFHYMRGTPYLVRSDAGIGKPENPRLGVDFSGTVEAVGKNVKTFKPGDDVFGGKFGSFAQYVTVREERAITPKPANVSFEQAAAVPIAGITALQALRDKGLIQPGQKVLINGASGGVGTFAVQLAKSFGADVTGVCSAKNMEMVRSIGADHVIDYAREDFTKGSTRYDLILDNVGTHSLLEYKRVLTDNGRLVIVGATSFGNYIGFLIVPIEAMIMSKFTRQQFMPIFAELDKKALATLGELMQAGKLKPVMDKRYKLSELPAAMAYLETGHARGKVVITVDDTP